MSRIIRHLLGLVLLVAIAGCGNSEKPPASTPTTDANDMKKQMEMNQQYQNKSQQRDGSGGAPPSGEGK